MRMKLFMYKLIILFSIVIVPIIVAAITKNIALSYIIGGSCALLIIYLYSKHKNRTNGS